MDNEHREITKEILITMLPMYTIEQIEDRGQMIVEIASELAEHVINYTAFNANTKNALEKESAKFQKYYKKLEDGKEHKRRDLVEHFAPILEHGSVDIKIRQDRKLFDKVANGTYIKAIPNV